MRVVARRFLIRGLVQGVGFRYFACRLADELGLQGWVKNLRTGDVEIHAQGDGEAMRQFLERIKVGPRLARVTDVEVREVEPEVFAYFSVEG